MARRRSLRLLLAAALTSAWTATLAAPATVQSDARATLVVNTTDDVYDQVCDASHCSLRDALRAALLQDGPDTVTFAIPTSDPGYNAATGVWTIQPRPGLNVHFDTTVDGSVTDVSASGSLSARPGIEIDGTDQVPLGRTGLRCEERVTLRGLIINRFQYGIWLGGSDSLVEGCYLGTDPTGTQARPNGADAILVADGVTGTIIQDNLISASIKGGIRVWGSGTSNNTVRRNLIGCDIDGSSALPHGEYGVELHAGAHDNVIGPDNVIAFNHTYGVWVTDAGTVRNRITQNSIHDNGWGGIRLQAGGNNGLAPPVVFSASPTVASGRACAGCTVEVFSDAEDQGATCEGTVVADHAGNWTLDRPGGFSGLFVTATATDSEGNTSAFSAAIALSPAAPAAVLYLPIVRRP